MTRIPGPEGDRVNLFAGFGTDAGLFQQACITSVTCGPGSIGRTHKPDELVSLAEFFAGNGFVHRILTETGASA